MFFFHESRPEFAIDYFRGFFLFRYGMNFMRTEGIKKTKIVILSNFNSIFILLGNLTCIKQMSCTVTLKRKKKLILRINNPYRNI